MRNDAGERPTKWHGKVTKGRRMRFKGKSVIVTGAASGIGRAVARRFASEGALLTLTDVNLAGLEQLSAELGQSVSFLQGDVSDSGSCSDVVASAAARHGRVDVLCNIAGVLDLLPLADVTDEAWSRIISINLDGVFYMSRAAMPHLIETRGAIINMASSAGLIGIPFNAAYTASKHGVIGLTKSLALEFARHGVRVNAICPTGVNTDMIKGGIPEGVDPAMLAAGASWLKAGPVCEPEDIADSVVFLASSEARFITGVALPVDGGQTAN
jgi:meso-butanediol dehydrogenase / (S,S)-butanediol dehydrogenase / diacetyl reductase